MVVFAPDTLHEIGRTGRDGKFFFGGLPKDYAAEWLEASKQGYEPAFRRNVSMIAGKALPHFWSDPYWY